MYAGGLSRRGYPTTPTNHNLWLRVTAIAAALILSVAFVPIDTATPQVVSWDTVQQAREYAPALRFDNDEIWYPVQFDYDGNWWGADNNEYWDEGLDRDSEEQIFDESGNEDEWFDGGDDGRSPDVGYGQFEQHRWKALGNESIGLGQITQGEWGLQSGGLQVGSEPPYLDVIPPYAPPDTPPPTAYYRVVERSDHVVYQYWFYYVYNAQPITTNLHVHEHDWESVSVWVSKHSSEPYFVEVSYHNTAHSSPISNREYQCHDSGACTSESTSGGVFVGLGGHGQALDVDDLTSILHPLEGNGDGRIISPAEWLLVDLDGSDLMKHSGSAYDIEGRSLDGVSSCSRETSVNDTCVADLVAEGDIGEVDVTIPNSPTKAFEVGLSGFEITLDGISSAPGLTYDHPADGFENYYSFNQIDRFEDGRWLMVTESEIQEQDGGDVTHDVKDDGGYENHCLPTIRCSITPPWTRDTYWDPRPIAPPFQPQVLDGHDRNPVIFVPGICSGAQPAPSLDFNLDVADHGVPEHNFGQVRQWLIDDLGYQDIPDKLIPSIEDEIVYFSYAATRNPDTGAIELPEYSDDDTVKTIDDYGPNGIEIGSSQQLKWLIEFMSERTGKVDLIAHSQGGIVASWAIHPQNVDSSLGSVTHLVNSLTTIESPVAGITALHLELASNPFFCANPTSPSILDMFGAPFIQSIPGSSIIEQINQEDWSARTKPHVANVSSVKDHIVAELLGPDQAPLATPLFNGRLGVFDGVWPHYENGTCQSRCSLTDVSALPVHESLIYDPGGLPGINGQHQVPLNVLNEVIVSDVIFRSLTSDWQLPIAFNVPRPSKFVALSEPPIVTEFELTNAYFANDSQSTIGLPEIMSCESAQILERVHCRGVDDPQIETKHSLTNSFLGNWTSVAEQTLLEPDFHTDISLTSSWFGNSTNNSYSIVGSPDLESSFALTQAFMRNDTNSREHQVNEPALSRQFELAGAYVGNMSSKSDVAPSIPGIDEIIFDGNPTPQPNLTPSPTVMPEPTITPTLNPTATVPPTAMPSPTQNPTAVPTDTPAPTQTPTAEPTATPSPTQDPTVQPTDTPVPTQTATAEPTATPSPTQNPTAVPTDTPVPTATSGGGGGGFILPDPTSTPDVPPISLPSVPRNVALTPGDRSVLLSWNEPQSDGGTPITGYRVVNLSTSAISTTPSDTTELFIEGLENGVEYRFQLQAINAVGLSERVEVGPATPFGRPGSPTNVIAEPISSDSVRLNWVAPLSDGGSPISGYVVVSEDGIDLLTVGGTELFALVTGLNSGVEYTFSVFSVNEAGRSLDYGASNTVVTPHTIESPDEPTPQPPEPKNVVFVQPNQETLGSLGDAASRTFGDGVVTTDSPLMLTSHEAAMSIVIQLDGLNEDPDEWDLLDVYSDQFTILTDPEGNASFVLKLSEETSIVGTGIVSTADNQLIVSIEKQQLTFNPTGVGGQISHVGFSVDLLELRQDGNLTATYSDTVPELSRVATFTVEGSTVPAAIVDPAEDVAGSVAVVKSGYDNTNFGVVNVTFYVSSQWISMMLERQRILLIVKQSDDGKIFHEPADCVEYESVYTCSGEFDGEASGFSEFSLVGALVDVAPEETLTPSPVPMPSPTSAATSTGTSTPTIESSPTTLPSVSPTPQPVPTPEFTRVPEPNNDGVPFWTWIVGGVMVLAVARGGWFIWSRARS